MNEGPFLYVAKERPFNAIGLIRGLTCWEDTRCKDFLE